MSDNLETKWINDEVCMAYRMPRAYDASKPTILLLHSFLMDSHLYEPQFEDSAYAGYNLIAVDEHGHGGTKGREDFTFWSTAEDSLALMDLLEITSFYVLGTSQGGFIALRIALLAPDRVKGLILLGTNALAEDPENIKLFKAGRDNWCKSSLPSTEALESKGISFGGRQVVGEDVWTAITSRWISRHAGPQGYDPAVNCLSNRDSVEHRLHEIKAPVLIMHGTQDKIYSVKSAESWSTELSNVWRFVVVDGGYHYLSFVAPGTEACRQHIPAFISATS